MVGVYRQDSYDMEGGRMGMGHGVGRVALAWADIKGSPGWMSKIFRLSLLCLIPAFGPVVLLGYAFGWARDIAWGVRAPMPERLLGAEGDPLLARGLCALVVTIAFALLPAVVNGIWGLIMDIASLWYEDVPFVAHGGFAAWGVMGTILFMFSLLLTIAASVFSWVGSIRASIYGRLSPGLQLSKIWYMMRYDSGGLLRIFGAFVACLLVTGIVAALVGAALFVPGFAVASSLVPAPPADGSLPPQAVGAFFMVGMWGFFVVFLQMWVACLGIAFATMLAVRAVGYWTQQFDVPRWGGQDDPMPFEAAYAQQRWGNGR